MKIKTYTKKHGIYNISADIHLVFTRKNSLHGYFVLKDLNVDAKACFDKGLQHSDLNEFVKSLDQAVEKFLAKNQLDDATHKKLLYIRYTSQNMFFNEAKNKSVDIDLRFDVYDTYWNGDVLLKVVDMSGKEITVEHNRPQTMGGDAQAIPYTKEAEAFIQEIVDRISTAQSKLQSLFERDFLDRNAPSLDEKINLLINSKQKLLEG